MKLKSYLLASALAVVPVAAQAAPPVYNWTGFYVGASGGFISQGATATDFGNNGGGEFFFNGGSVGDSYTTSGTGGIFGINAGYNWQTGNLVFGIEADIAASTLDSSSNARPSFVITSKLSSLGTVRGRFGYAFDRVLVYATGGLAYGHVKNDSIFTTNPSFHVASSGVRTGWTLGGGFDYAVTDRWSIRVEGLYVDLGKQTGVIDPPSTCRIGYRNTYGVGRLGANFRF